MPRITTPGYWLPLLLRPTLLWIGNKRAAGLPKGETFIGGYVLRKGEEQIIMGARISLNLFCTRDRWRRDASIDANGTSESRWLVWHAFESSLAFCFCSACMDKVVPAQACIKCVFTPFIKFIYTFYATTKDSARLYTRLQIDGVAVSHDARSRSL